MQNGGDGFFKQAGNLIPRHSTSLVDFIEAAYIDWLVVHIKEMHSLFKINLNQGLGDQHLFLLGPLKKSPLQNLPLRKPIVLRHLPAGRHL
jgi:hypothetical protein